MPRIVACDLNTLNQNSKCFSCFSQKENMAAVVYFLNQTVAKLQGVTPQTPNQLRATTRCLACLSMDPVADNKDASVAQQGAILVGDTASNASIAAIRKAINPFVNMNLDDMRSIELLLRCQLNAFLGTA
jgi:hypothetical protein